MKRSWTSTLLIALGLVMVTSTLISLVLEAARYLPGQSQEAWQVQAVQASRPNMIDKSFSKSRLSSIAKTIVKEGAVEAAGREIWLPVVSSSGAAAPGSAPPALDAAIQPEAVPFGDEPQLPAEQSNAEVPVRLVIPVIQLDAPVVPAGTQVVVKGGEEFQQWLAPDEYAAGWHADSAMLGEPGNTVLNGHHNIYGKVFGRLVDLKVGDLLLLYGSKRMYGYMITNRMILPEKYEQLDVRMDNARWILPSTDERLTMVTCWPEESNTHRLILVARPIGK
jgi:LPXTG-site transpeptidase (sortase) family protein